MLRGTWETFIFLNWPIFVSFMMFWCKILWYWSTLKKSAHRQKFTFSFIIQPHQKTEELQDSLPPLSWVAGTITRGTHPRSTNTLVFPIDPHLGLRGNTSTGEHHLRWVSCKVVWSHLRNITMGGKRKKKRFHANHRLRRIKINSTNIMAPVYLHPPRA